MSPGKLFSIDIHLPRSRHLARLIVSLYNRPTERPTDEDEATKTHNLNS